MGSGAGQIRVVTERRSARFGAVSADGFTLIEVLVVVGIMALLIALLLPTLGGAKEQGRRAKCLANLRSIGQGAVSYALSDPRDLLIPIHTEMIAPAEPTRFWLWRTAIWFSFGGRSSPQPLLTDEGPYALDDNSPWAARTRPLNLHVYPDIYAADAGRLDLYHCPSDRGYPRHVEIDDSPLQNAERPCYDTLGNSYRASLHAIFPQRDEGYVGAFSLGPWGQRLTTVPNPSQVAAFGEPTFFNMIGRDDGQPNPPEVIARGWHGQMMRDNLVYCDGSARPTTAEGHETVSMATAALMNVGANWRYLSRGRSWRFDLWPRPGARIWSAHPEDQRWNPPYSAHPDPEHWPFVSAVDNLTLR